MYQDFHTANNTYEIKKQFDILSTISAIFGCRAALRATLARQTNDVQRNVLATLAARTPTTLR